MQFFRTPLAKLAHKHPFVYSLFSFAWVFLFPLIALPLSITTGFLGQIVDTIGTFPTFLAVLSFWLIPAGLLALFFQRPVSLNEKIEAQHSAIALQKFKVFEPLLIGTFRHWMDRQEKMNTKAIELPSGFRLVIDVQFNSYLELDVFDAGEPGNLLFSIGIDQRKKHLRTILRANSFITDTGDVVTFDFDKLDKIIARFETDLRGLLTQQAQDAPVDALLQIPQAGPHQPWRALFSLCRLDPKLADWFNVLAGRATQVCADALEILPLTPDASPARDTLEDYVLPRLTALLPACRAFAGPQQPADDQDLIALRAAVDRLVQHAEEAMAGLRTQVLQTAGANASTAVLVLDTLKPMPAAV